jgi:O-antigen/teichoic acid export membrane protein
MLSRKARITIGLATLTAVSLNCLLWLAARQILSLFGHIYADQAVWSLRILGLGAFPLVIRDHYIAICRIQNRVAHAVLPLAVGVLLELAAAALGAHLGGLLGLSLGWVVAVCVEATFMSRTVYKATRPMAKGTSSDQDQQQENLLRHEHEQNEHTYIEV